MQQPALQQMPAGQDQVYCGIEASISDIMSQQKNRPELPQDGLRIGVVYN
jgi:hypothetical protein